MKTMWIYRHWSAKTVGQIIFSSEPTVLEWEMLHCAYRSPHLLYILSRPSGDLRENLKSSENNTWQHWSTVKLMRLIGNCNRTCWWCGGVSLGLVILLAIEACAHPYYWLMTDTTQGSNSYIGETGKPKR